jgi:hypothetical protein
MENMTVSWDRITPNLIDRAWDLYEGKRKELASAESKGSEGEFPPHVRHQKLQDLV